MPHAHEYEDCFQALFGSGRGSNRVDTPPLPWLSFRSVRYRNPERIYDAVDALVRVCERCGDAGFLLRDWDDAALPALCTECYEANNETPLPPSFECEAWCDLDLDHSQLCAP
jgi:hypothetical protein